MSPSAGRRRWPARRPPGTPSSVTRTPADRCPPSPPSTRGTRLRPGSSTCLFRGSVRSSDRGFYLLPSASQTWSGGKSLNFLPFSTAVQRALHDSRISSCEASAQAPHRQAQSFLGLAAASGSLEALPQGFMVGERQAQGADNPARLEGRSQETRRTLLEMRGRPPSATGTGRGQAQLARSDRGLAF